MNIDLEIYKNAFKLPSAIFTHIDHSDAIIAEVYKVVTPDKRCFILKICPNSDDYHREVYFLQKFHGNIPVPRIIDTLPPSHDHFGAILMEYIEGDLLKEKDWNDDLAFEIGATLARIHSNCTEGYGDLTKPNTLTPDITQYFYAKFYEELDECKENLPPHLIQNCKNYISEVQNVLAHVDGPLIVHRDFRPGNIIVSNGKLQGIIDWAGARSGFAEQDFCTIEHFRWIPNPQHRQSFLEGYTSIRPIPSYQSTMPFLQLGRALAVIGYTVKSNTWNNKNSNLYTFNRQFLESFPFSKD